jgi:hypothetical protein
MTIDLPEQNWVYTPTMKTLLQILFSLTCWIVLYNILLYVPLPQYKKMKDKDGKPIPIGKMEILDIQNRMVSFIHGLILCILSFIDVTYVGLPYGSPNTGFQSFTLTFSLGYFLYDTLAMYYYGLLDAPMMFHHGIVCLGVYLSLCFQASGAEILGGMFISEVSNPVMHARLIVRSLGLRHTKIYESCEFIYIFLYIYYRLFKGIFVVYNTVSTPNGHPIVKAIAIGVAIQSYFYVYRMVSIVKNRMKEMKERKKGGVQLYWFSHNTKVEKLPYFIKSAKKDAIP